MIETMGTGACIYTLQGERKLSPVYDNGNLLEIKQATDSY